MKYHLINNSFNIKLNKKNLLKAPKIKRTHCYIQNPSTYDICCPICGSNNTTWSEYESHIWCYDCKYDVYLISKYTGIFSGPIPIQCASIFGIYFDRINIETQEIINFEEPSDKYNSTWVKNEALNKYSNMLLNKIEGK